MLEKHATRTTQTILPCWEFVQPNRWLETSKKILSPWIWFNQFEWCYWNQWFIVSHPYCWWSDSAYNNGNFVYPIVSFLLIQLLVFCFCSEKHPSLLYNFFQDQQICADFRSINWGSPHYPRSLNDIVGKIICVGYKLVNVPTDKTRPGPLDYGPFPPIEGITKPGS